MIHLEMSFDNKQELLDFLGVSNAHTVSPAPAIPAEPAAASAAAQASEPKAAAPEPARAPSVEQTPAPDAAAPTPEAKKRGRPPAVKPESVVVANAQPAVAGNTGIGGPATPPGDPNTIQAPPTIDDVKKAAQAALDKLGNVEGMSKVREVLVKCAGVRLIRDIKADKARAVIDGLKALAA